MITKELIDTCSVFNVAKTIAYWAKVDEEDFPDLLQRCTKLLDELKEINDYWVCDDKNFSFAGYMENCENVPNVILTSDASKLEDANWKKTNDISSYDWSWENFLGLTIHDRSLEKYGADVLLGKILYRIMYYDYLEDEIRKIRKPLENRNNINQVDLYLTLIGRIYIVKHMKSQILDLVPSEEMKNYIDENFDNLSASQINSIICGALISLEDKLLILTEIKDTDEIYENTYNAIKYALSHLELKENDIFILKGQGIDEDYLSSEKIPPKTYEHFPYNSYEKAIKYIKDSCCQLFEYNSFEEMCIWFVLEKWVLNKAEMYEKVISYYITLKGDMWLYEFDYGYKMEQGNNAKAPLLENIDFYADLKNLEIPTPYKFGDLDSWIKVII